jgi:hypothetical protein
MGTFNRVLKVIPEPGLRAGDWVEVRSREEILATSWRAIWLERVLSADVPPHFATASGYDSADATT